MSNKTKKVLKFSAIILAVAFLAWFILYFIRLRNTAVLALQRTQVISAFLLDKFEVEVSQWEYSQAQKAKAQELEEVK